MDVGYLLLKEPSLNGAEWDRTEDKPLFAFNGWPRAGHQAQFRDGLVLEQLFGCQVQTCLACPAHDLNAQDRVASEFKEIVMDTNSLDSQHLCPDLGQHLFSWRAWRNKVC